MSTAYTPGLKVCRRVRHRAQRLLPIPGDVLVNEGDQVRSQDVVARTLLPGDITPFNLAQLLGVSAADVARSLKKKLGEQLVVGELLAESSGFFGWFPRQFVSPVAGTVESVSQVTGQVMIRGTSRPVQVLAYLDGSVVSTLPGHGAVIEADVSLVQGIFGLGGEAFGPLRMAATVPGDLLTADRLTPEMRGCVVVGGARITAEAVQRGRELGVSALVAGGIDDHDLRDILGFDLGVAVTGTEQIGLTLIITEGFGDVAMSERTFRLLEIRAGVVASVNGATQIRAGVLRPEVVIPWPRGAGDESIASSGTIGELALNVPIRIIRDPYFGGLGRVKELPSEPQWLESGSRARVVTIGLSDGRTVTVPRANIELIEE